MSRGRDGEISVALRGARGQEKPAATTARLTSTGSGCSSRQPRRSGASVAARRAVYPSTKGGGSAVRASRRPACRRMRYDEETPNIACKDWRLRGVTVGEGTRENPHFGAIGVEFDGKRGRNGMKVGGSVRKGAESVCLWKSGRAAVGGCRAVSYFYRRGRGLPLRLRFGGET